MDYLDFELLIGGKKGNYSVTVGQYARMPEPRPHEATGHQAARLWSYLKAMEGTRGEAGRIFAPVW